VTGLVVRCRGYSRGGAVDGGGIGAGAGVDAFDGRSEGGVGRIRELVEANRLRMNKIAGSIVEMQRFSHQVGESMRGVASISEQNTRAVGM